MKAIKTKQLISIDALHEELQAVPGLVIQPEGQPRRALYNVHLGQDDGCIIYVPDDVDEQVIKKLLKDHDPKRKVERVLSPKERARDESRQRLNELIDQIAADSGNHSTIAAIAEALREIARRLDERL